MKKKLLSLKQKRELLQRMAATVRRGGKLDAFCKKEGVERKTLFEYLVEMRAIGTKGINPFLPDLEEGEKLTKAQRIFAAKKIEAYAAKTGVTRILACGLAGISRYNFTVWKKRYDLPRRHIHIHTAESEKRRIVSQAITDINSGMMLKDAVKKAEIDENTFRKWEKQYTTTKRLTYHEKRHPVQAKKRIVRQVITDVNNGMSVVDAAKKAGIGVVSFRRWEKQYATIKRLLFVGRRYSAQAKKRIVRQVITNVNKGMYLEDAAKKAGINTTTFYAWEKLHATTKRIPYHKQRYPAQAKKRIVRQVITNVNKGMMLKDAAKKAGINATFFYEWEKLHATTKRIPYHKQRHRVQAKKRIVCQVITDVNNGMVLKDAIKKAGICENTFCKWEKQHATTKRLSCRVQRSAQAKKRILRQVITDANNGMMLKDALKKAGINPCLFYKWGKQYATIKRVSRRPPPKQQTSPQA